MSDRNENPPAPALLDDVLITGRLSLRPSRPPDHAAENRALAELARALAVDPESLLGKLADLALRLCRADSAGVSILERDGVHGLYRWPAIAGSWARHAGGTIRVDASPSGVVIDRDAPQLFALPERHFGHAIPDFPAEEALAVPFRIGGRPAGAVWAVVHTPGPAFDAEDARLLAGLSDFAASAYQVAAALRAAAEARGSLERRIGERTAEAEAAREFAEGIVDTVRDPLLVLDADLRVVSASREFYRTFRVEPAGTEGRPVYDLGNRQWDIPRLRTLLEEILPLESAFRDFEVEHRFQHIGRKVMLLNAREVRREGSGSGQILLAIEDVTERRDAEEARREAEARFTEMVKNVRDHSIFLTDPEGVITSWNVAAERILGYAEAEAVGRHFSLIFSPEDVRAGVPGRELLQAREEGRAEDERWHVRKGGEPFWALGIVTPLHVPGGRLSGFSKILRDMTDRKAADVALRQSVDRQEFLLRLSDALRDLPDEDSVKGHAVGMVADHLGLDRCWFSEVFDDRGISTVGPERIRPGMPPMAGVYRLSDYPELMRQLAASQMVIRDAEGDPRFSGPERSLLAGLQLRALVVVPLREGEGRVIWALAAAMAAPRGWDEGEIRLLEEAAERTWAAAERARAESALAEAQGRLRLALSAARMGTWTWDLPGDAHRRDANLNALLGLPAAETEGTLGDFLGLVHPGDRATVRDAFDQTARRGRTLNIEFRVVLPDGSTRWLRDQGDVFGMPGRARMTGACVDVTDLKDVEAGLRASEETTRAVTEVVPDLLWRLDVGAGTGWVNRRWVEYTGLANDAVPPWGWLEAVHPDDRPRSRAAFERGMAAGLPFRFEHRLRRAADGAYRWFLVGAIPLRDDAGRITHWFGAVTDVHDQRVWREELEARIAARTADLHAEVGRRNDLTRRLATAQEDERQRVSRELHDTIGQSLTGLSLALKAVQLSGELPARAAAELGRAQGILDGLGRELHGLAVRLRPTSLDDFGLEPALQQLVAEWSARSGVRVEFQSSGLGGGRLPPEVETAIYRVVQEALTNVAKHAGARMVGVVVARPDRHVTAVIEDDGAGFDPAAGPRARLGLMGMRERVDLAGGELEVESSPGSGTSIFVRIPLPGGDDPPTRPDPNPPA